MNRLELPLWVEGAGTSLVFHQATISAVVPAKVGDGADNVTPFTKKLIFDFLASVKLA